MDIVPTTSTHGGRRSHVRDGKHRIPTTEDLANIAASLNSYGTYDHVMLLLGRLANFAAKDLVRKRKANSASPQPKGGSPQFPGIVPTADKVTAPRGFSTTSGKSPQSQSNEEANLDISIKDALREWESIRGAFAILKG